MAVIQIPDPRFTKEGWFSPLAAAPGWFHIFLGNSATSATLLPDEDFWRVNTQLQPEPNISVW